MKKEKQNIQFTKEEKNDDKRPTDKVQKRDVSHGDINYDPGDPHGLKINQAPKQEKK